jgi:arylsulfatase A-like enzyme
MPTPTRNKHMMTSITHRAIAARTCRAFFLLCISAVSACGDSVVSAGGATDRPNILLILADDLGVMDVCSYARAAVRDETHRCAYSTPNIDRLAAHGALFRHAYAAPLCSPSRASLVTGIYGPKLGFNNAFGLRNFRGSYFHAGRSPDPGFLAHDTIRQVKAGASRPLITAASSSALAVDESRPSLPLYLTDHRSAFIGKWHLGGGGLDGYQPGDHGFEEIAYLDEGFSFYFDWQDSWHKPGTAVAEYLTDDITAQASQWIEAHAADDRPFFLLLSHFAVHSPYEAKRNTGQDERADAREHGDSVRDIYASMVRSLDDSVGALVATLRRMEILDNTLLIFISDNGGVSDSKGRTVTTNLPFRGQKGSVYEGGIRVPLILHWPGVIDARHTIDTRVDITDLFPTVLDAAGYELETYAAYGDGQSLLDLVDPERAPGRYDKMHFFYDPFYRAPIVPNDPLAQTPKSVVIADDYKLVSYHHGQFQLFDLASDPKERYDVADRFPGTLARLYEALHEWELQIPSRYRTQPNPAYRPDAPSQLPPLAADSLRGTTRRN